MANMLLLVFGSIFAADIGHYFVDTQSWQHTKLFGGFLNPPTPGRNEVLPGELSFITWIFHWSMIIDYCYTLPRYMWRWGEADCTGNRKWKLYTLLHSPAFLVNAIVVANHLHRDQLTFLKILHPIFVFIGSIATLFGSFAVSKANGWNSPNIDRKAASSILRTFRKDSNSIGGKDWGISYTLASIAAGSVLAYGSLYLSV